MRYLHAVPHKTSPEGIKFSSLLRRTKEKFWRGYSVVQTVRSSAQVLAVWETTYVPATHKFTRHTKTALTLLFSSIIQSCTLLPVEFSGIPGSKIFSPMTRGGSAAMKTVEDTSSKALAELIDYDGSEGVYLDYQRHMKFKKGSPRTHLRILQCPLLPKHFVWATINVIWKWWTSLVASMIQTHLSVLSHKLLHLNHILIWRSLEFWKFSVLMPISSFRRKVIINYYSC